jgi:uncharacterized protein (TIGR03067 family)
MMYKMMALAVVLFLGADAAKDDSSKLQGTWQAVSSNKGGQDDPNADQHSMTFEKDTVVIKRGDQVILKGTFKLDAAKSPRHIDIDIEEGPEKLKGKTGHGIYELKRRYAEVGRRRAGRDRQAHWFWLDRRNQEYGGKSEEEIGQEGRSASFFIATYDARE